MILKTGSQKLIDFRTFKHSSVRAEQQGGSGGVVPGKRPRELYVGLKSRTPLLSALHWNNAVTKLLV